MKSAFCASPAVGSRFSLLVVVALAAVACKENPPEPPPPPPPVITFGLNPTSLTFTDTLESANPAPVDVAITSTGDSAVTGLAVGTIAYGETTTGWLTFTLSGTAAPARLTLQPSLVGLVAGTYTATVPVTAAGAANSPQSVSVVFRVFDRPPPPPDPPPSDPPPGPIPGVTIVASANIGRCNSNGAPATQNTNSSNVVASISPDVVFVLGDNAYPVAGGSGDVALVDYETCYGPTWGRFRAITYAAVGGREQDSLGVSPGADAYFGPERVGPPGKNYYSFNLGSWHIIVLDILSGGATMPIPYGNGSAQLDWLRNDLAANAGARCTLAFWHDPMWYSSSNTSPSDSNIGYRRQTQRGIWAALYEANADVVLGGGDHIYERFAPMRYVSNYPGDEYEADSVRGIRQISTGLGGDGPMQTPWVTVRHPLSVYRSGGNGVLRMTLGDGIYTWQFFNAPGSSVQDWGSGACH